MSDVLVVGCGYLGRRVAALCRAQGREVAVTTRRSEGADEFRGLGLEPVVCDVLDPESLKKLPTAGTTVYCVGFDRSAGRSMRQVYVDGLRNVLYTPAVQAGSLIYVSSTGVYGSPAAGSIAAGRGTAGG
jgi:nucleoside-diphosphate-sugar epimerase